jgi:hypothetical protein
MFEEYLCEENGRYDFFPKNKQSALDEVKRGLRQSQKDMRQCFVDDVMGELCMLWGEERRATNPKLHPIHENVGTKEKPKWVRVDPETPESNINDAHRYNQAVAIPAFITILAGQIGEYYHFQISDSLLKRLESRYPKWITEACKASETDVDSQDIREAKESFRNKYKGAFDNFDYFFETLKTIKAKELKQFYYGRIPQLSMCNFKDFFADCSKIVPQREERKEKGWNYEAGIKY